MFLGLIVGREVGCCGCIVCTGGAVRTSICTTEKPCACKDDGEGTRTRGRKSEADNARVDEGEAASDHKHGCMAASIRGGDVKIVCAHNGAQRTDALSTVSTAESVDALLLAVLVVTLMAVLRFAEAAVLAAPKAMLMAALIAVPMVALVLVPMAAQMDALLVLHRILGAVGVVL